MTHYRMPPIRITYDNAVKRPSESAERKSRAVGMQKAVAGGMAVRFAKRIDNGGKR